mmetsp:Transcript_24988/g.69136  ORF Transcript_24988/g.69136 Transcript_24988/m.69136 type:complete len:641 (+) Transcript_24988:31-1953(+)
MSSPDGLDDFGRRKRDGVRQEDDDDGDREGRRRDPADHHKRGDARRGDRNGRNDYESNRSTGRYERDDKHNLRDRNRDRDNRPSRRHNGAPRQSNGQHDRDYHSDDQGRERYSDEGQRHRRHRSRSISNDSREQRRGERGDGRRNERYNDRSDEDDDQANHRREDDNQRESNRQHRRPPHNPRGGKKRFPEQPEIGSIVRGYVVRIENYGAFLEWQDDEIDDFYHRGLIHISEMSDNRVGAVQDVVRLDDRIFSRVVRVEQNRVNLSLRGLDIKTGDRIESVPHDATYHADRQRPPRHQDERGWNRGGRGRGDPKKRAHQRNKMMQRLGREISWKQQDDPKDVDPSVLRLLYSPSPACLSRGVSPKEEGTSKKGPVKSKGNKKGRRDDPSDSESDRDSSASQSSSSEDSRSRRKRKQKRSRSSRYRETSSGKRRRRSSSSSSESSDSSSSANSSSSSENEDENVPQRPPTDRKEEAANTAHADKPDPQSVGKMEPAADDSDDESVGPRPLTANADGDANLAAQNNAAAGDYGGALLPGEGQAMAQFVQQNLRVPRRGEIGYGAEEIDSWEQQGYVMSGSRHARMNAVRIRKENQVYSAEEQRALALITLEENQKKEAALMDDFRGMLEEKKRARESAKNG